MIRIRFLSLALSVAATGLAAQVPQPGTRALTLGDAARLASRQSASAEAARLRASQADARVRQQRADLLPSFTALAVENGRTFNTATFGISFEGPDGVPFFNPRGQVEGPVNILDARGRVSQSVVDFAALGRLRSAQASALASDADASRVAEDAAALAATTYLRAVRADAQLAARIADSTLAEELLGIAREQLEAGVGIALDVTRAESQRAATRAQIIAARNERDRARLDLMRTLGLSLDVRLALTDSLDRMPIEEVLPDEKTAIDRALHHRFDLRVVDEQSTALARQVTAIRAERLPSVSVFGDNGIVAKNGGSYLGTYNWGVQMSVPLFDGFRRESRLEEQAARQRELDVQRRDLQQQIAIEVRSALLDMAASVEQVGAATERTRLAEQEVSQARDRFRAGVAGNADVINASLSLNAARTQLVDALTAYHSARLSLARAEGAVTELK